MATIRKEQLVFAKRQFLALEKLATMCDVPNPKGKHMYSKLRSIEYGAEIIMTAYCNGEINSDRVSKFSEEVKTKIQALFNNNLQGLKINTDPRGYYLKIDDEVNRTVYADVNLHRDMGGYGILAPDYSE